MKIVNKKLTEIMPYEKNPRNNEMAVDKVAASIEEFGFKQPLVIDAAGVIVVGHTRYLAAKKLGLEEVPCVMADDLDPYQIKAYRLADNKVAEFSSWDFTLLEEEMESLEGIDLSEFGFESDSGYSYIDDLLTEDFANDSTLNDKDSFNITFTFPIENEAKVNQYVKGFGKEKIVQRIIKEAENWAG